MSDSGHIPVLLDETLDLLSPQPGQVAVDCTLGRGGHALALARAVGPTIGGGRVIGFDLDPGNLTFAAQRLKDEGCELKAIHDSFVRLPHHLREMGVQADIVLADLGFSSTQMDDPSRGFSFSAEGPLDMRLDPTGHTTAADLIAAMTERELADVIYHYGEDPFARKIARKIVQSRQAEPIRTTARLARLVQEAYGQRARSSRMHPATRTFMALRIAVNDELAALRSLLDQITAAAEQGTAALRAATHGTAALRAATHGSPGRDAERRSWLSSTARIGIISFHSLEDRMVKQTFAELERRGLGMRLTKRPVTATEQEARGNPRARSAKLRVVRLGDNPR